MNIKPLRVFQRLRHRKDIPTAEWKPDLIRLFDKCKKNIASSPVLVRCDSEKPVFLKMDWSTEGMEYILFQPYDSTVAKDVSIKLSETR